MFFLPRQTPLICLAIVLGLILTLVIGMSEIVYVLSGVLVVVLVLAVVFDLWEPPER